jgi:hypothetical protein
VLPPEHPHRVEAVLASAIAALEREDEEAAAVILQGYMDDEEERINVVRTGCLKNPVYT